MMTGQNIVCFANDWDSDPTSKHHVMKILARSNRVLWVNSIGLRKPTVTRRDASRILGKVRQFCSGPVAVSNRLHVVTPLAIPFYESPAVSAANAWWVGRRIRMEARKLGMDRFQMWTFLPNTAPLIRYLMPEKVVYYCVDEWSEFSFLNPRLMRQVEAELIAQSDLVIVSSHALYEAKRRLNPHTHLVPHGVDSEHFARALSDTTRVAPELEELRQPIVGFWGLIHEWIDLELIQELAKRRPDWSFVLVGKVAVDIRMLERLPNLHFLGSRPYDSLPSFAKGFRAVILPFKINRLTENVNPIKLREYLAAGLPVVSTPLPEARRYADVVFIGRTREHFMRGLDEAMNDVADASLKQRIDSVANETWLARVERISTLVEKPHLSSPGMEEQVPRQTRCANKKEQYS